MASKDQRTEPASHHKRLEDRRKGKISRSKDIVSAGVFMAAILLLKWSMSTAYELFRSHIYTLLSEDLARSFTVDYVQELIFNLLSLLLRMVGPLVGAVFFLGIAGNIAQGGWNISGEPLKLNPSKLLPKNNFTRVFSGVGIFDLFKNVLLFLIIGRLGWKTISSHWAKMPQWSVLAPRVFAGEILTIIYDLAWDIGLAFLALAAVHFFVKKQNFAKEMRMTKEEVKDEAKQLQGNPIIKGKIRRLQMQLARRRMMQEVPSASVVITNPTHFAVALSYDSDAMHAPKVVAKGRNWLALRIREIAEQHQVPIVENRSLAQLLYRRVEVNDWIPVELYRAVAEVLAYLVKARRALAG